MLTRIAVTAAAVLAVAGTGWSQWTAIEEAKLTPSDPGEYDYFGRAVAVSGDTAVVGSWFDDHHAGGTDAGSAYVFVRSGTSWSLQQKLTASDAAAYDYFGQSVAVSGDTLVVGTSLDDGPAGALEVGAAYVFVRSGTTWSEQQKLAASDGAANDYFGAAVAVSGDTIVVGAYSDDHAGGAAAGSAYLFVRSGTSWIERQKLTASDAAPIDLFGGSVAISSDTVLVGAYGDDHADNSDAGSAYVFVRSGTHWTEQAKLTASDAAAEDSFGDVSISGNTAVVAAFGDDHAGGVDAGSAYVFVRSGTDWTEQAKLTASDAAADDLFGRASVSDDTAVVGAFGDDHAGGVDAGSAYVFVRIGTDWTEQVKLVSSDASDHDRFGTSISLSDDTLVVGAWGDHNAGVTYSGSAYALRLSLESRVTYCTSGTSGSGCQALLSATGTASASASSGFSLLATGVEGQKDGLFFFGASGKQASSWGNGTSYQCVVPPVVRAPLMTGTGTSGLFDGSFALDLNALWCPTCPSPAKNPGAGSTVQAQLWYRDPLSTSNQTTSLSDAIEFVVDQ